MYMSTCVCCLLVYTVCCVPGCGVWQLVSLAWERSSLAGHVPDLDTHNTGCPLRPTRVCERSLEHMAAMCRAGVWICISYEQKSSMSCSETKTITKCGTSLEDIIPFLSKVDTTLAVPYSFKVPKHALACAFFVYSDSERESIAHKVYDGVVKFVVRCGA